MKMARKEESAQIDGSLVGFITSFLVVSDENFGDYNDSLLINRHEEIL